jgi:dTDP-4-amino-4,6-dideoxygalactose transaminase
LRLNDLTEEKRDEVIEKITAAGVAVNVHFLPLPMLTVFKQRGYEIDDFPIAYDNYSREISLPIYPQLDNKKCEYIVTSVTNAVEEVMA